MALSLYFNHMVEELRTNKDLKTTAKKILKDPFIADYYKCNPPALLIAIAIVGFVSLGYGGLVLGLIGTLHGAVALTIWNTFCWLMIILFYWPKDTCADLAYGLVVKSTYADTEPLITTLKRQIGDIRVDSLTCFLESENNRIYFIKLIDQYLAGGMPNKTPYTNESRSDIIRYGAMKHEIQIRLARTDYFTIYLNHVVEILKTNKDLWQNMDKLSKETIEYFKRKVPQRLIWILLSGYFGLIYGGWIYYLTWAVYGAVPVTLYTIYDWLVSIIVFRNRHNERCQFLAASLTLRTMYDEGTEGIIVNLQKRIGYTELEGLTHFLQSENNRIYFLKLIEQCTECKIPKNKTNNPPEITDITKETRGMFETPQENSDMLEIPVENSGVPEIPVENSGMFEMPQENSGMLEIPVENSGMPEITVENSGMLEIPVENSDMLEIPLENSGMPEIPVENSGMLEIPVENSGMLEISVENSGIPEIPVENSGMLEILVENSGMPEILVENSGMPEIPAENSGMFEIPVENSGMPEIPVENCGMLEIPVENSGMLEIPAEKSDMLEIPVENSGMPVIAKVHSSMPKISKKNPDMSYTLHESRCITGTLVESRVTVDGAHIGTEAQLSYQVVSTRKINFSRKERSSASAHNLSYLRHMLEILNANEELERMSDLHPTLILLSYMPFMFKLLAFCYIINFDLFILILSLCAIFTIVQLILHASARFMGEINTSSCEYLAYILQSLGQQERDQLISTLQQRVGSKEKESLTQFLEFKENRNYYLAIIKSTETYVSAKL